MGERMRRKGGKGKSGIGGVRGKEQEGEGEVEGEGEGAKVPPGLR